MNRDTLERVLCGRSPRRGDAVRPSESSLELPGRHFDGIRPDRAADILLECAGSKPMHDVWTLAETLESQRLVTQHMIQERRRVRT